MQLILFLYKLGLLLSRGKILIFVYFLDLKGMLSLNFLLLIFFKLENLIPQLSEQRNQQFILLIEGLFITGDSFQQLEI
jgi:hypothetical protein